MTEHDPSLDETQPVPTPATPPAADPAPAPEMQRVVTPRRGGALRWLVAAIAIVLVVGVTAGATMMLTGRAADPNAFQYLPADTALVMEVRPDLPGDQKEHLAGLLSKFPGFADQAALPQKIDEVLDRASDALAKQDIDYANKVKPFLGGPIVVAVTDVAKAKDHGSLDGFLAILTVDEGSTCASRIGPAIDSTVHGATTISTVELGGKQVACAVDGRQLILGTIDGVAEALDTKAGSTSLEDDADLALGRSKLSGDTVAMVFVSRAGMTQITQLAKQRASAMATDMPAFEAGMVPAWVIGGMRLESNGVLNELVAPLPADLTATSGASPAPSLPASKTSTLAPRLPATTIGEIEIRDFGTALDRGLTKLEANPKTADTLKQVNTALGILGGRAKITGWMGDAAIVVTEEDEAYHGGLVIETPKPADAQATFTQLRTLLALGGGNAFSATDEPYGDGQITTITIDLQQLGPMLGISAEQLANLPKTLDLAYTVQKGAVVIGVGSQFVKSVVDTTAGHSLADQTRYKDAMSLVGASNSGQAYADLAVGLEAIEERALPKASADERARFEHDIQPYLAPLDAAAWSATFDGGFAHLRFGLTAHEAQNQ
jgi:hypothetical protein